MSVRYLLACGAVVFATISVLVLHANERRYQLQVRCMDKRANWETRPGTGEVGCRYPGQGKD